MLQPPEEVDALVCLPHQTGSVVSPGHKPIHGNSVGGITGILAEQTENDSVIGKLHNTNPLFFIQDTLYPISGTTYAHSDDGSSPLIVLQRPFLYFGQSYTQIYVNNNGHLTFDAPWYSYVPQQFPMYGPRDIIAPFWTDLDNRGNGEIYHNQYTSGSVLQQATRDINQYFPGLNFNANWVFVATWYEVAYYPFSGTQTTFQAVLISGGRYSFVLMNYGEIALTSRYIQAGYDTLNSAHHFTIPGSFSSNATGSFSDFRLSSNVNVPGRWAFRTDYGSRGCTFNGDPVQLGDSFWSDRTCAQKCTCTSTGLQCRNEPCSFSQICQPTSFQFSCQTVQRRTCTISGDPHYYTFDNTVFHFQGTCTYVLSEQCNSELPYYRVEGKNEHRGSTWVSWTRLVKVHVYNDTIELVKGRHGEAKVNGNFATTPFSLSNGTVQVYESGFSVIVSTDFGLVVSYDTYSYVQISVPYTYQNGTCGLCGNFNNRPEDDFQTRQRELVSSDVVFANSWQASGDDEPGCEPQCGGLACAVCTAEQRALYSNTAHCGILESSSGPFAPCHQQLPPQTFAESCVYDLCVGGGYQPILCRALNVYASQCRQSGVQLPSWRRPGFCEIPCPANSHFESEGTGCPSTCVNPNSTNNCPLPPQESCICDSGYVLSGGVCVPHAECGCSFEGRYYRSGQTVILDEDCGRSCSCSYGSMTCRSHGCGPLESCSVEDGERGCRPNSYAACWIRGPGSYHMFDGLTYQYPGACQLTLSKVTGLSSHPHFTVTAEKVPRGQQGFSNVLKFEAEGTQVSIQIEINGKVQVDGQLIRLPFSTGSNGIQIFHSSIYSVILRTSFGVTVQTVWPHFVRITAPGIYNGSLGGLCGNYNGNPHDDFRTPSGVLVNSSQDFGDSWRDGSLAAYCVESINRNSVANYSSSEYCGILSSPHGPFVPCWSVVEPRQQVDECVEIMRGSSNPAATLCEVLRDYALMCQEKGVALGQWRNSTGCELTCPSHSHYELCGTSCPSACPSLSFPFTCDTVCQEGCQCDNGFVLNGDQCVPPTACGCYHQGRYRQAGEQFWDGEQCQSSCTCNGVTGNVQCIPNSCGPEESCRVVEGEFGCHSNPRGTCSASGDPHYLTFDRKAYDFQGTCRYVLATLCNATDGLNQFSVEAKNEAWSGLPVSITAEVFVNVWGYQVHMSRYNLGRVEVNGITQNLPILLNGSQVSIFASGYQTFVIADFGLSVMYDGSSTVSVSVPPNYRGKTCGLCGNFNGNPNDDFNTPSGITVTSPNEFGQAWKVPGNYTCSDGCGSSCPRCANEQPARAQCEVIQAADGPFSFCHEVVDPAPYFSDCVFDVCVSGNQGHDLLCRALESYVIACQSANVRIYPWRQNTTCRLDCPANSHYELCGTDCHHTCTSSTNATCEQACSEGCFCDAGFSRSGPICVPEERCGCQYHGFYYNAGESFWTDGCSQRCECHAPNDLRCSAVSCTPAQQCTIRNGQLGCYDAMSTCTVWGDPHYITYDGALAHFQGTCSYIITESTSHRTNETQFQVIATNNHRGNNRVSFVSAVDIYLSNQPESVYIRIGPNKRIKVNGREVSFPTTAGTLAEVVRQGSYIAVNAGDLTVQFDGQSTLLVRIGQNRQNRVTGMCGNFNGNSADDKASPNGTLAQNDHDFGQSWKSSRSQAGCGSTDQRSGNDLNDCTFREEYSQLCSVITNTSGPFSACHLHSDPQPFFTSCVYDLCLYTPANGMLCSAVSAYERTCSVLELDIPEWRSALHCDGSDPCEQLNCTEYEWCGKKDGIYGCFCDEHHDRRNNDSYDSTITCASSSGTMSVSRCQLFEAGFPSDVLHLRDESCNGTLRDGQLVFHFDNDNHLCGTALRSNGTHFMYENTIQGNVDPNEGLISRQRSINLRFCCEYPLNQALSMAVGINPVESIVRKKIATGNGQYRMRMIPFQDSGFQFPLSSDRNIEMEIDQRLYVEVRAEEVDQRQISTVLDSCWATPVNLANYPVRWNLIVAECPNQADGTVELIQNGVSNAARFSFRMFTFTNYSSIYIHCNVHLCLLRHNNCTARCYPGYNRRVRRDAVFHDTASISLGPLLSNKGSRDPVMQSSSGLGQLTPLVALLASVLLASLLVALLVKRFAAKAPIGVVTAQVVRRYTTSYLCSFLHDLPNCFLGPLYPISGTASSLSDDGSSPQIALLRPFLYFGRTYNNIYVNHNGHLTFNSPLSQTSSQRFPQRTRDVIAPFWTDLDNRRNGQIYYNQYTSGSVLQQATQDINQYFPGLNFNANWVFVATWYEVAYYPTTGTRTTVQAVLISGGQYTFVLMNYGIIASTTRDVQAGYDTIDSAHYVVIPGSFTSSATGSNSNFRLGSNVNEPGRWAFRLDNGSRGCTFNGDPVQLGDSFWSDRTCAQKCTCTSAGLQCRNEPCSFSQICQPASFQFSCQTVPRGTCTISGDPHYYTFDNTVFHFQGTCTYVLSEQCNSELPYYRVEGKNEHRGSTRVAWTRLVKVHVYNDTIELVKGRRGEAKVNGNFATTPFSLSNGTVQVYESGFSVIVSTDFGLVVSYDTSHYVQISVPYTYQNATCGLCGNFNNHPQDDFQTRQGELVSSDVVFANSWQALGDDEPGCEPQCGGLGCAVCTAEQTALYSNTAHCGILESSSGPFAPCHQQLPPQTFVESCVYDLCVGGGYQPILCQALNVYASQCQQSGVQLPSWRRPGFCEIPCPANSHFESEGTGCPSTCVNPNSTNNCPLPPQESCICDSGYVLSGGVCVPHAECGCSFEGRYYRSGQTVILDEDCGRSCSCSYGSMTCRSHGCGPLESCSVQDGERGCRPNSYAACWIRGPGSYHMFDGLTYQYPGACQLTLSKVMGLSSHPHFMVTAEKVPRGQQGFARIINFEAEGIHVSIEMARNSKVQVDGQLIRLPFSTGSNGIQIFHSSIYSVILRTSFGVTVQTVWPHFVRITAPGIYNGSLGGLCGNYNGNPHDDFRTPNGVLVNSSQDFGDSWRDGSLAAYCVESMNNNSVANYSSSEYCGILSSPHGPFVPCWSVVEPRQQVDVCVEIMRGSSNPAATLCEVLRDYALMCQQKGVALGQWRNSTGCELICPSHSHYELCGTSCPSACPSLSFPFTCDTVCQEGCQCDNGFILNGDQCVPPTSCGCYYQGRYHQAGEQFWDGEQCLSLCTCNGVTGNVHCIPNSCGPQESCRVVEGEFGCHPNPHGTCSASGDPHYITFDRKAYDFQGTCRYVLATLCNATDGLNHFSVEAKNEPLNGLTLSIVAEVFVNVWGYQVHMSRDRRGLVQVNGEIRNLPVLLNEGNVSIYATGSRILVSTNFGLSVNYNGFSTVFISIPPNYREKTCGLCGNFNGNPNDDFHTPSGMIVTTPDAFGTAWKVPGNYTCSDGCGSSCPQCTNEQPARAQCEVIQAADGPFSFCHAVVDPAPYFNDCVFDVCLSGNQGHDFLCRAIESYVSACQSANVQIYPWRENSTCTLDCPANSHYELCGIDCGHTCASSIDETCEQFCSEGCFCNEGFVKSGTRCVPVESCGCQHDGFYYNAGESFWTDGCSQRCECHAPNDLRCSAASCTPGQQCTIRNGQLGCYDALSTCTVWGDPHYITFDGAVAHFQGTCSYIIAESTSHRTNETQFQVIATNNHRGNNRVSFVSAVDVYLSNEPESVYIRIGSNRRVKVNGNDVSLPTTVGTLTEVARQGSYIVVDASDLLVQFDGQSTLLVRLGQNRQNRVTGMCGNFNNDPSDDKVLPNGTLAQNDNYFGHSWKSPTSQPGCGSTDEDGDGLNDCTFREEYSQLCSVITNTSGPFSACHLHSDPQPFFTSCVYDLCLYTPANGMLCSAVSAYEKTCSVLGLDIPEWRSALHCDESDPCEQLSCTEYEWCGEKDGVYGCFCDEHHHRPSNESYDSSITCVSSSGTMSLSRCQLFEAGFHSSSLHLRDESCKGTLENGRLVFRFNNDDQLCGTTLRSNGTHFSYENTISGDVDPHDGLISREKSIHLHFSCDYPLAQALSMDVGINPVESIVNKRLPPGLGRYHLRMIPYEDPGFHFPLTRNRNLEMEIDERLFIEVQTQGVDEQQISTILDSCWATPINNASCPVRWDLITTECPNPADGTVELVQNGVSTVARFSFRMFTFTNFSSIYLHCQVHLCVLRQNNCTAHCYPGYHTRVARDIPYHDREAISLGPLVLNTERRMKTNSSPCLLTSLVILIVCLLTANILV
ncbi:IgGFc-binding protein [Archocentrus centrarchus]|uniref:IgGFc-binding protein n=1 Tax=Archocentrus centrarchus TaxID=63155 RepID=UPI0011EA2578|nr:IgGFc-binding protein-like [Archocentrus centrarchus]